MKSRNVYSYPVNESNLTQVLIDSPAHVGSLRFSVDFVCPELVPVLAALDGQVVFVKQVSNRGGPDKRYYNDGNRIVLKHASGEYSAYEHLSHNSAKVEVGQNVIQGEVIALSGNTGFSFEPHLHFEVFSNPVADESEGETLEIVFG